MNVAMSIMAEDNHEFPANCKADVVVCPQKAGRSEVDSTHCKTDSEEGSGSRRLRHRRQSSHILRDKGGEADSFSGPAETNGAVIPASSATGGKPSSTTRGLVPSKPQQKDRERPVTMLFGHISSASCQKRQLTRFKQR
jgi:hypothetical protein